MADDIEDRATKIIAEQFGVDPASITPETNLTDDLGSDSLDQIELVMGLEAEFNVVAPDDEADKVTTVAGTVDLIRRLLLTSENNPA